MEEDEKLPGIQAYHGSPHDFDQFDISKIGTGEGAQAFGHGLYFAESEPVAIGYRDNLIKGAQNLSIDGRSFSEHYTSTDPVNRLKAKVALAVREGRNVNEAIDYVKKQAEGQLTSRNIEPENKAALLEDLQALEGLKQKPPQITENPGRMYEVNIAAHPDHFLDWDKPIYQQPEHIQNAVHNALTFATEQAINGKKSLSGRSVNSENNTVDAHPDEFLQHDGATIQYMLQRVLGSKGASEALHTHGIKGIKYLDGNSRTPPPNLDPDHIRGQIRRNREAAAKALNDDHRADLDDDHQILLDRLAKAEKNISRNFVVFDDKLVSVKRKYEDGGAVN